MLRIALLCLVTLSCARRPPPRIFRAPIDASPSAPRFQDLPRVIELDSGLTVALLSDPATSLVSVDMRYRSGSATDPAGAEGLAHLAEHVSFLAPPEPGAVLTSIRHRIDEQNVVELALRANVVLRIRTRA